MTHLELLFYAFGVLLGVSSISISSFIYFLNRKKITLYYTLFLIMLFSFQIKITIEKYGSISSISNFYVELSSYIASTLYINLSMAMILLVVFLLDIQFHKLLLIAPVFINLLLQIGVYLPHPNSSIQYLVKFFHLFLAIFASIIILKEVLNFQKKIGLISFITSIILFSLGMLFNNVFFNININSYSRYLSNFFQFGVAIVLCTSLIFNINRIGELFFRNSVRLISSFSLIYSLFSLVFIFENSRVFLNNLHIKWAYFYSLFFILINIISFALTAKNFYKPPYYENRKLTQYFIENFCITPREVEVIELILAGLTYKEISEKLFISYKTVDKHIQNIYSKLNVTSKIQLVNLIHSNIR